MRHVIKILDGEAVLYHLGLESMALAVTLPQAHRILNIGNEIYCLIIVVTDCSALLRICLS